MLNIKEIKILIVVSDNPKILNVTFKIFGLSLTSYNILISLLITIGAGKIYFNYDKN